MSTALKLRSPIARSKDLFRIRYGMVQQFGAGKLGTNAHCYLMYFVALLKIGFEEIQAPVAYIVQAKFGALGGTNSKSSANRAFRELEKWGFIKRHQFRIGEDHFRVKIEFNLDKLKFFMRRLTNIGEEPTSYYSSPYRSNRPQEKLTNKTVSLRSDPGSLSVSKLKSKPRAKNKKTRRNAVLYTIGKLLEGRGDRRVLLRRAENDLRASGRGKPTILDWGRLSESYWQSMTIEEREGLARAELLPLLLEAPKTARAPGDDRLRLLVSALAGSSEKSQGPELPNNLSQEDVDILKFACERSKVNSERLKKSNFYVR